jgi:hypothetical protein
MIKLGSASPHTRMECEPYMNCDRYDLHVIDWLIWRRNVSALAAYILEWRSELPIRSPYSRHLDIRDDWTGLSRS